LGSNAASVTGDGFSYTVLFSTIVLDTAGAYNATTGNYVTSAGTWLFGYGIQYQPGSAGGTSVNSRFHAPGVVNNVYQKLFPTYLACTNFSGESSKLSLYGEFICQCPASLDVAVQVQASGGSRVDTLWYPNTYFYGYKLH